MIKNKINNLNLSATLKINEISKKLEQEGKKLLNLVLENRLFQFQLLL